PWILRRGPRPPQSPSGNASSAHRSTDMSPFDPLALCQTYFDAWRRHDAQASCAGPPPGGHYEDPLTGGPIRGDALCGYVQQLWSAFPDLDFELGDVHRVADGRVHGAWTMVGHNTGSFQGLPPSGRSVRLNGLDRSE